MKSRSSSLCLAPVASPTEHRSIRSLYTTERTRASTKSRLRGCLWRRFREPMADQGHPLFNSIIIPHLPSKSYLARKNPYFTRVFRE